jgi:hypothetical protein
MAQTVTATLFAYVTANALRGRISQAKGQMDWKMTPTVILPLNQVLLQLPTILVDDTDRLFGLRDDVKGQFPPRPNATTGRSQVLTR